MSTRGHLGDFSYRLKLIITISLVAATIAIAAGNRFAWQSIPPANHYVLHYFEAGYLFQRAGICSKPMTPATIKISCVVYQAAMRRSIGQDYLAPKTRDVFLIWPSEAAIATGLLVTLGLAIRTRRFKKLDEHAPRDHFKPDPWSNRRTMVSILLFILGFAGALATSHLVWIGAVLLGLCVLGFEIARGRLKIRHIRGTDIKDAETVAALIEKRFTTGGLEIGGVPIPRESEVLNFLIAGAPGTGKSVSIGRMLHAARHRGDRIFCADPRGDYVRRFWLEGDLILNPLDARAVPWSPLAEIVEPSDAAALARSIVPPAEGADAAWHTYAAQLLEGILLHTHSTGATNAEVVRLMLVAKVDELRTRLSGHPAAGLLPEEKDSPMFHSLRGTAAPYIASLTRLDPSAGRDSVSLRRWARDGAGAAWWPYSDAQIAGLRNLISTQLDLMALGILEQPDDRERRTWLCIDEFAALGRLSTIEDFLARARKAGGVAILGLQSVPQLRRLYGEHSTDAMLACCANVLACACGDPVTADYMSRMFGEREISVVQRTSSQGETSAQAGQQRILRTERLILPSELDPTTLPKLRGFLRVGAGGVPIAPVTLEILSAPEVTPRFMPRPGVQTPPLTPTLLSPPAQEAPPLPDVECATPEELMDRLAARVDEARRRAMEGQ